MDVQAESLPTIFAGCALLGGAGLLLALLRALNLTRSVPLQEALRPGGGTSPRLSLYSSVSFGLFFGLGGLLAGWLGLVPELQLVAALLSGLAVGGVTAWAWYLAGPPRPDPLPDEAVSTSLVGHTGRVTLSPHGDTPGRVLLSAGQRQPLPAQSRDRLIPGDRVLIVADAGDLLDVLRWEGDRHP